MKSGRRVRVLAAAGLDPSGRAGLLADVETIRALGAEAFGVATAVTAQGRETFALEPVPVRILRHQLRAVGELARFDAIKVGMVPSRAAWVALRTELEGFRGWWIVDPVTTTSRGEPLSSLRAGDYLSAAGPRVLLTPNAVEAAALLGWPALRGVGDLGRAAAALGALGFGGVVVKGGHLAGPPADVVWAGGRLRTLSVPNRLQRSRTWHRGSGCRFSAALAVGLARREHLHVAARHAQRVVRAHLLRRYAE